MDGINRAADRISSGQRIDFQNNAAEAAISGRFDSLIGEATVSIRNATNQISSLHKADQSLEYTGKLIEQVQSYAVQTGNGALSGSDLNEIEKQGSTLIDEALTSLDNASFNRKRLFGENGIDIEQLREKILAMKNSDNAMDMDALKEIHNEISIARATIGAEENVTRSKVESIENELIAAKKSRSNIADADFAEEFANLLKEELIFQANVKVFNHRRLAQESIINMLTE